MILLISLLVAVLGIGFYFNKRSSNKTSGFETSPSPGIILPSPIKSIPTSTPQPSPTSSTLPSAYMINNVPFAPQAPYGNWDELHDEACEEAVLTIADYYSTGRNLTADIMENEIKKMVAWEINYFGSHKDLTSFETADMGQKFYGLNFKVRKVSSMDDIKKEISQNHLVIVPTAGRLLGNPNFRSPGPIYHMLVISGYDGNQIITQDVGTRNGKNYIYHEKVLFNAIHDWNGTPENIEGGQKAMLTVF